MVCRQKVEVKPVNIKQLEPHTTSLFKTVTSKVNVTWCKYLLINKLEQLFLLCRIMLFSINTKNNIFIELFYRNIFTFYVY